MVDAGLHLVRCRAARKPDDARAWMSDDRSRIRDFVKVGQASWVRVVPGSAPSPVNPSGRAYPERRSGHECASPTWPARSSVRVPLAVVNHLPSAHSWQPTCGRFAFRHDRRFCDGAPPLYGTLSS